MANTLTSLIPDAFAAMDVVSRELVGFIPGISRDTSADRVAINQSLRIPVVGANTAGLDITPAMAFPARADQTVANVALTITKQRAYPFSWTNEERYSLNQGPGVLTINQGQIAQAMRAAVNEMESDIAVAANLGGSRAYGTAGTTAFATNLGESAQIKKILDDNGAPGVDRSLVVNTSAGAALRTLLNNPLNANTSLSGDMTRQGVILGVNGFNFRESAQVVTSTAGAMASATSTSAAFTVGQTAIPLATAGTGVVAAGDIITSPTTRTSTSSRRCRLPVRTRPRAIPSHWPLPAFESLRVSQPVPSPWSPPLRATSGSLATPSCSPPACRLRSSATWPS